MQSHQLKTRNKQSRKRIARGGARGTYSGRGMKGQKSRSGGNVDPLFEGGRSSLADRLKKAKGFKSIHANKIHITLTALDAAFQDGDTVNPKFLVRKGLVDKARIKHGVKILANGTITKKLTIAKNVFLSQSARDAIEKAGGEVQSPEVRVQSEKKEEKK